MTATAELCGHRWPQIVDGWQKGDDHRCERPAGHEGDMMLRQPQQCRCRCGATTTTRKDDR